MTVYHMRKNVFFSLFSGKMEKYICFPLDYLSIHHIYPVILIMIFGLDYFATIFYSRNIKMSTLLTRGNIEEWFSQWQVSLGRELELFPTWHYLFHEYF